MIVSGKVVVGSNSSSAWIYGGKQIGVAGPIECQSGPMGPSGPIGPMGPSGRPPAAGAGRPAGGLPFFVVVRRRDRLNRTLPNEAGTNWATPCEKYTALARPFFCCFLSASRSRDWSHSIGLEKPRYPGVFMPPELRCGIQTSPRTIRFWCGSLGNRPATKSSPTKSSNRHEKDAQRYLEPDTPNINPRWFFWTCSVTKMFFCGEPLIKLQNTKVLLN